MDISENSALWKCEYKNFVIKCVDGFQEIFSVALDFKRSPCSERCILSLEWFRGFWILLSAFKNTVFHIHRRCKHSSCYHRIWSWNSVPKRRHKIQTPGNHPKERIQQTVVLLPNVTLSVTRTDTILHRRAVRHNDPMGITSDRFGYSQHCCSRSTMK